MPRLTAFYGAAPPILPRELLVVPGTFYDCTNEQVKQADLLSNVTRIPCFDIDHLDNPEYKRMIDEAIDRVIALTTREGGRFESIIYPAIYRDPYSFGHDRRLDRAVQTYIVNSLNNIQDPN